MVDKYFSSNQKEQFFSTILNVDNFFRFIFCFQIAIE